MSALSHSEEGITTVGTAPAAGAGQWAGQGGCCLSRVPSLAALGEEALGSLASYVRVEEHPVGTALITEGETERDVFFILGGTAAARRADMDLGKFHAGRHFGELALVSGRPRAASVVALTPVTVARLEWSAYHRLMENDPRLASHLLEALLATVGRDLTGMTDLMGTLLRQRSLPRHVTIQVTMDGQARQVPMGTQPRALLPATVGEFPVVAALVDNKAVALDTPLSTDVTVAPLTTAHWEGERIYRRSLALLLMEAAAELVPDHVVRLGASTGHVQWIEVAPLEALDRDDLAKRLNARMREMVAEDRPFHQEWWTVEEAIHYFRERGWEAAVGLLRTHREATVPLVTCGRLYALSTGPLVCSASVMGEFEVLPAEHGLILAAGGARAEAENPVTLSNQLQATVMRDHEKWLRSLGVRGVGRFNASCIDGEVSKLIRVAEGFHEKRIGQIADTIAERAGTVRVICIAGPSSSGKTTFIKRLSVQLQVNGLDPVGISLDNYYLDREKTVRDATGEFDFEALEALDLALLREQLSRLLAGEKVKTALYDFARGMSIPEGCPEIHLKSNTLLMLEGIHGLNPRLLRNAVPVDQMFRIFIQPMSSLAFDRLSRVNPSDLRLIRRVVRDRHGRGCSAADNIARWPSVRAGERKHIFPHIGQADAIFDTSLIYELSVLKIYAERYLLEVPQTHPSYATAHRLRQLIDRFVAIYPDHVPPTSIIREFIGGSSFEY